MHEDLKDRPSPTSRAPTTPAGRAWFGTAGWSYEDWKGRVYPQPQPRGFRPLEFLSRVFDCAEINLSFYRNPDLRLVEGWLRQVRERPDFQFTAKLHQRFTHGPAGEWGAPDAREFLAPFNPMQAAGRLASFLVQLPWSARFDDATRERLRRIAGEFRLAPLVLEVRHASWDADEARAWIRASGFSLCAIDQPDLRDCLRPADHVTGPVGYVRLHGRNRAAWFAEDAGRDARYDYLYSSAELDEWVPRIQRMLFALPNVYVVANNHYRGQAPANALQLRAKLSAGKVRVPAPLLRAYPELERIALPGEAGRDESPGLFDRL